MTGIPLGSRELRPNHALRKVIDEIKEAIPVGHALDHDHILPSAEATCSAGSERRGHMLAILTVGLVGFGLAFGYICGARSVYSFPTPPSPPHLMRAHWRMHSFFVAPHAQMYCTVIRQESESICVVYM